ncbi:MAG TPA: CDP-alcohol phosphatidyltransferase family protein [Deltaproteobacteria bacterium]|jgi:CDP-diacylglycerol--glycerol-3-phosphate 3-phosphatidyltransferase|nr:CDP-alcohol phosphatidyltransferase family protein [Deltaproteobacteria bacterium]
MIKAKLGDRLDAWLQALLPFLFRRPLSPNLLTVLGTLVSLGAAVGFAFGQFRWAGVLILAGGFFDLVDGVIARHQGTASTFGAFLDSTLDRLVDMGILLGIVMHYAGKGEPGLVLLAGYALVVTVLVSYTKARAELVVPVLEGGLLERGERIGLLAAGAILGFMVPALWIVAIGATITVVQRFSLAYREMAQLDASSRRVAGAQERS